MIQFSTWTRTKDDLELGLGAGRLIGVPSNEVEAMAFPADRFAPQLGKALRRIYGEEHGKGGPTTWRLLSFPLMQLHGVGAVPTAVFLIFERQNGEWTKTVGHIFILAPSWLLRLPECCRTALAGLAHVLLGDSTEVDVAA